MIPGDPEWLAGLVDFSIAIPHTPWIPEREASLAALLKSLDMHEGYGGVELFEEREPNWSWSLKMWQWAAGQPETHFLQLQDDVIPAPNFWPALTAMVTAVPDQILGLQGAHPSFRLLARDGRRWARSHAWMVGVGYVIPQAKLRELVAWREQLPEEEYTSTNEDDLIGRFCVEYGYDVWHPIPTIIDHDTSVKSTYRNDDHLWRRPTVTWREYGSEIESAEWWRPDGPVPLVSNPHQQACWMCQNEPSVITYESTGARIGRVCLARSVAKILTHGVSGRQDRGRHED